MPCPQVTILRMASTSGTSLLFHRVDSTLAEDPHLERRLCHCTLAGAKSEVRFGVVVLSKSWYGPIGLVSGSRQSQSQSAGSVLGLHRRWCSLVIGQYSRSAGWIIWALAPTTTCGGSMESRRCCRESGFASYIA